MIGMNAVFDIHYLHADDGPESIICQEPLMKLDQPKTETKARGAVALAVPRRLMSGERVVGSLDSALILVGSMGDSIERRQHERSESARGINLRDSS